MLKIWWRRSAFNVQKAMWFIGELGLNHDHINAGGDAGGLETSAFNAMNPHGRIPAGTTLYRYFEMDIDRPNVPHVEAWYGRLRKRPAYQRHVMLSSADLFGRLDF
jgi:glutathione S-transferase